MRRLVDELGLTQRDTAVRLGKSLTYINELLRVLQLPDDVLEGVRTSEQPVSKSLLLEITKQPDEAKQRRLWRQASADGGLTVKEARQHKRAAKPSPRKKATIATAKRSDDDAETPVGTSQLVAGWSLTTKEGVVSVQLHGGNPQDPTRVQQALEEALGAVVSGNSRHTLEQPRRGEVFGRPNVW